MDINSEIINKIEKLNVGERDILILTLSSALSASACDSVRNTAGEISEGINDALGRRVPFLVLPDTAKLEAREKADLLKYLEELN